MVSLCACSRPRENKDQEVEWVCAQSWWMKKLQGGQQERAHIHDVKGSKNLKPPHSVQHRHVDKNVCACCDHFLRDRRHVLYPFSDHASRFSLFEELKRMSRGGGKPRIFQ